MAAQTLTNFDLEAAIVGFPAAPQVPPERQGSLGQDLRKISRRHPSINPANSLFLISRFVVFFQRLHTYCYLFSINVGQIMHEDESASAGSLQYRTPELLRLLVLIMLSLS
jgi:hypothetical protein